ncbi:hypothetical protein FD754_023175 [Muntiacus muntjak]|uniref:Centrosomal protein of 126 kDa n=1 Tax=Muntiacus muntjak TaxID=9888 RepID=A0A5N3UU88_MUNMU|nr:hypothetical protein FD754_023175 [Muntiacus muntjak]
MLTRRPGARSAVAGLGTESSDAHVKAPLSPRLSGGCHRPGAYLDMKINFEKNLEERQILLQQQKICRNPARKYFVESNRRKKAFEEKRKEQEEREHQIREQITSTRKTEVLQRPVLPLQDALKQIQESNLKSEVNPPSSHRPIINWRNFVMKSVPHQSSRQNSISLKSANLQSTNLSCFDEDKLSISKIQHINNWLVNIDDPNIFSDIFSKPNVLLDSSKCFNSKEQNPSTLSITVERAINTANNSVAILYSPSIFVQDKKSKNTSETSVIRTTDFSGAFKRERPLVSESPKFKFRKASATPDSLTQEVTIISDQKKYSEMTQENRTTSVSTSFVPLATPLVLPLNTQSARPLPKSNFLKSILKKESKYEHDYFKALVTNQGFKLGNQKAAVIRDSIELTKEKGKSAETPKTIKKLRWFDETGNTRENAEDSHLLKSRKRVSQQCGAASNMPSIPASAVDSANKKEPEDDFLSESVTALGGSGIDHVPLNCCIPSDYSTAKQAWPDSTEEETISPAKSGGSKTQKTNPQRSEAKVVRRTRSAKVQSGFVCMNRKGTVILPQSVSKASMFLQAQSELIVPHPPPPFQLNIRKGDGGRETHKQISWNNSTIHMHVSFVSQTPLPSGLLHSMEIHVPNSVSLLILNRTGHLLHHQRPCQNVSQRLERSFMENTQPTPSAPEEAQGGPSIPRTVSSSPVREKSTDSCPGESRHRLLSQQDCEGVEWAPRRASPHCPHLPCGSELWPECAIEKDPS